MSISDESCFEKRCYDTISRANGFMVGKVNGYNVELPFSWDFSNTKDRHPPFRMHSFLWLVSLLTEYWYTNDIKYRDKFIQYVFDWIRVHPEIDLNDKYAWHDDATARRTLFFCITLVLFEKSCLNEYQVDILKKSIEMQVNLLCKETFYKKKHNHGIYQDRAIAFYGLTYAREPEYYLILAKERAREYFEFAFTKDGVHKEHSPSYHMDMIASLEWYKLAYSNVDIEFSLRMQELIDNTSDYICWITQPDMKTPPIGDSKLTERKLSIWCSNPNYEWIYTKGRKGFPPKSTAKIFWEAGYAVFRSNWNFSKSEDTWMMLLAATHSEAHKHNDDLSFLLYHKGPLFVEAGKRDYNYHERKTQYAYSAYAHNVLFINNKGYSIKEKTTKLPFLESEAYDTRIIDGNTNGDIVWATGMQTRFSNVCQNRTMRYDKKNNLVFIEDDIYLDNPATIRLIYHIAKDISIEEKGNGWIFKRGDIEIASALITGTNKVEKNTYLNDGVSPWDTWLFCNKGEEEGGLVSIDMLGEVGLNNIKLEINLY